MWAGTSGELDDVPVADIRRFEREFLDYIQREEGGLLTAIRETGQLSDDGLTSLKNTITEFKKGFQTSEGDLLAEEPVEAIDEEDVEQETITRVKKG